MSASLFGQADIANGLTHLPGFATADTAALLALVADIAGRAPFRHMLTPWGKAMSVAMTNCGALGWTASQGGYRYTTADPEGGALWPAMPELFIALAAAAATRAGYPGFTPDACLINRYIPGAQMTMHQDRNERDLAAPIVSLSLGLPATFLWGGAARRDKARRIALHSGDVVVWGGPARLNYHGILPLKPGHHPDTRETRINLTFRKVVL